jgi:hypothetical protein
MRAKTQQGFSGADLLMIVAGISVLGAIGIPALHRGNEKPRYQQCAANLSKVARAVLMYADENQKTLPALPLTTPNGVWWFYKEQVKRYAGLEGKSSPADKVFACPSDRGYDEGMAFYKSGKSDFNSYCFNGVNLVGVPNIAGRQTTSINDPARTLLVMEWTAHAPLSWHNSKTGRANEPFYDNAESLTGFVDGHVGFTRIYYDGLNPAYSRDPISGYEYKYSGD